MRVVVALLIVLAGCAGAPVDDPMPEANVEPCQLVDQTWFFGPGHALQPDEPAAGSVFSNGFDEAFLVDEMDEWRSPAWSSSGRIVGNLSLEYWVRNDGTPAPVVIGGQPGEGYHWFNQVGTEGGFVADYGREYASATPMAGSVDHYVEVIAMPPGGLHVERGQSLRVLLTSLVLDDDRGTGQHILIGGDTPSQVRFQVTCMPELDWVELVSKEQRVSIPAHQGLITGQVPPTSGLNVATVPFILQDETQRLTIRLEQTGDPNPLKDDMDLVILDAGGAEVASIGSPYADEVGTFYAANLAELLPPGDYRVQVNSYSGHGYEGVVRILQETATLSSGGDSAQS